MTYLKNNIKFLAILQLFFLIYSCNETTEQILSEIKQGKDINEPISLNYSQASLASNTTVYPGGNIQNAINSMSSSGGGTVYLAAGNHIISSSIILKSNVNLEGVSSANYYDVIIMPNSTSFNEPLIANSSPIVNINLRNFKIRGNLISSEQNLPPSYHTSGTAYTNSSIRDDIFGIKLIGEGTTYATAENKNINIEDVEVRNCSMGIHLKGMRDIFMKNLKLHQNGLIETYFHNIYLRRVFKVHLRESEMTNSPTANGINVSQSEDVILKYNKCNNNFFRGLRVEGEAGYIINNVDLFQNETKNNGQIGFRVRNVSSGNISTNTSTGNGTNTNFYATGSVTFNNNSWQ
ncbi:hypothetical protein BW723_05805 [Polaribacter reichenbachii]|uniref:Rhamnogalacturonase A/B/Epimerase-like pectate lyase domain-containing protein n=1 Tax=Polaribacter reichenbachii TaxID=996801 RepID=A0A1B8TYZ7_9FLAO|nr:glycosyl hydrolase family 28-related protein [Polaribacter reichenbachii]APZ45839.1 hypothetical protein BW723_05805 [Polaribacter reichenbachii]AUC19701.1 hypothetical protein BTO17_13820 [Polaribacter reichenbachii]OBY64729.1 hypothetical protein LPB301_09915 [Polaribacter reichenbachii]